MVTDWAYDTDFAQRRRPAEVASRSVAILRSGFLEGLSVTKLVEDLIGTYVVLGNPLVAVVDGHKFDEADVVSKRPNKLGSIRSRLTWL